MFGILLNMDDRERRGLIVGEDNKKYGFFYTQFNGDLNTLESGMKLRFKIAHTYPLDSDQEAFAVKVHQDFKDIPYFKHMTYLQNEYNNLNAGTILIKHVLGSLFRIKGRAGIREYSIGFSFVVGAMVSSIPLGAWQFVCPIMAVLLMFLMIRRFNDVADHVKSSDLFILMAVFSFFLMPIYLLFLESEQYTNDHGYPTQFF